MLQISVVSEKNVKDVLHFYVKNQQALNGAWTWRLWVKVILLRQAEYLRHVMRK